MAARGDGELFRSREAQVYIEEGEESVLMQRGDFTVVLVQNAMSQLAAVVAMVGEVQWPLGRDCAVTRTGERRFSFSLPGSLSYALVLRNTSSAADMQSLEKLLEDYSMCSSPPRPVAAAADAAAGGQEKEGLKQADKNVEVRRDAGQPKKRSRNDLSPEMVGRMQRARRMSAVAKVFSKSLERGAISIANHVQPMDMATQDSRSSPLNLALAGVDAVARVVEAVETGGRTLLESAVSTAVTELSSAQGLSGRISHSLSGLICSGWTLNKHGLLMLYRVITASMAMHSGASSRSGTSRSGSSSSSEFGRLLSSSSSSSSLSSKLPLTSVPHAQLGADARETAGIEVPHAQVGADARGADATSVAALPLPAAGTAPSSCTPPPPPLFASYASPRGRISDMPPPSGPVPPAVPLPSESLVSSSFRIYKPRPTPATASSAPPAGPPPFLPRPPRFQPPQN